MNRLILAIGLLAVYPLTLLADTVFPANQSNFYYKIGGGQDVPSPAVADTTTIPLKVDASVGAGFSCSAFDPRTTITNSLNNFGDSIQNISGDIVTKATSAITSFPMFMLLKANPKLYNILNNNVLGAHNQFAMKLKSCETIQAQAARGQNPYNDWVNVSINNQWKKQASLGGDLNAAKQTVDSDNGNSGVPWYTGKNAGGQGQPPILVIGDTTKAGFNVLLGRDPSDMGPISVNSKNARLAAYWKSPQEAADWVTTVVGEHSIKTCKNCEKDSKSGVGLLPEKQALKDGSGGRPGIRQKIADLVSGRTVLGRSSLEAVSAPGIVVSTAVIHAMQNMDPNTQAISIDKLADNVATTKTVDAAQLAKRILEAGSQVPAIRASEAAQRDIRAAIQQIDKDIDDLIKDYEIRRKLVSNVISDILGFEQAKEQAALNVPRLRSNPQLLKGGAIVENSAS